MGKDLFTTAHMINAISGSGGIVSVIAKRAGCTWHTAKSYIERYPTVKAAYEDECAGVDDLAESTVIKAIKDGDVGAAKWWLEKRRRDRFSDRLEVTGAAGGPVNVSIIEVVKDYGQ